MAGPQNAPKQHPLTDKAGGGGAASPPKGAKTAKKGKGAKKGMGPHGRIFLGKDAATFGEDGIGYEAYDPDFECGGPPGTEGRQCPHVLTAGSEDTMGLAVTGREGRLLHVGIASYRDPLCPRTLYNMFTKASDPSTIRVRVLQQNDPDLDVDCLEGYCKMTAKAKAEAKGLPFDDTAPSNTDPSECPHADQVVIHQVHAKEAKGPTWARGLLSGDFADAHDRKELSVQDHCMSIDSHMDFEPEWDGKMIDMWDLAENEYAVLSTYVAGTEQLGKNLNKVHEVPHLCMVTFTSNVRTHATKMAQNLSRPKLTNTIWGAGLSFSKCHAELKVPVDPHTPYIFDGEEFNRAARFFTHGYDVYTPNRVYVLHDYHGSQHNPTTASWHRNTDQKAMQAAHKRLKTMIEMPGGEEVGGAKARRIQKSRFGMGDRRSVDALIEFSGVDTRNAKFPVDGKNRCGNLKWEPFAEHPGGVNVIPRFDAENEDPLDLPYDKTSVWYDPNIDAHGGMVERREAEEVADNADADTDAAEEEAGSGDGDDPLRLLHRDHEAHDAHENLPRHHEELRRAIHEAEKEEEREARPVVSNAERHGAFASGALRGGSLIAGAARKLIDQRPVGMREHGWKTLPTPVKAAVGCLLVGLIVAITLTAGTGRGALVARYNRRRNRRKAV